ncbi:27825_t:CDS:2, partial [Racocetra persica]
SPTTPTTPTIPTIYLLQDVWLHYVWSHKVSSLLRNEDVIRAVVDPPANTTTILYDSFVVPTLTRHEKDIDKALGVAQEQATNKGIELSKEGIAKLYQIAAEGLLKTGLYTPETSTSQAPLNSKEKNQES